MKSFHPDTHTHREQAGRQKHAELNVYSHLATGGKQFNKDTYLYPLSCHTHNVSAGAECVPSSARTRVDRPTEQVEHQGREAKAGGWMPFADSAAWTLCGWVLWSCDVFTDPEITRICHVCTSCEPYLVHLWGVWCFLGLLCRCFIIWFIQLKIAVIDVKVLSKFLSLDNQRKLLLIYISTAQHIDIS